jgi:hypothetical protein
MVLGQNPALQAAHKSAYASGSDVRRTGTDAATNGKFVRTCKRHSQKLKAELAK